MDLEDLGDDVEVSLLGLSLVEGGVHVARDHGVGREVLVGPLSQVLEGGSLALLKSGVLAGVVVGLEFVGGIESLDLLVDRLSVCGEESPGAAVEHVGVELSLAIVQSQSSSVHSDDVSDSLDDGEIFESLGVQDEGGVVAGVSGALLLLEVERGVHDLEGADVSLLVGLVGEGGINDGGVEVLGKSGGQ